MFKGVDVGALNVKYPRGVFPIFFTLIAGMMCAAFTLFFLVLYCVHGLGFGDKAADSLFGAYVALMYMTHIAGGYIAERYLGYCRAIVVGAFAMALGLALIAFPERPYLIAGLSIFILGVGLLVPCIFVLLGRLYATHGPEREAGFILAYIGMNIGAFLAGVVGGQLEHYFGFKAVFLCGSLVALALTCFFIKASRFFKSVELQTMQPKSRRSQAVGLGLCLVVILALAGLLTFAGMANVLLLIAGVCCFILILQLSQREKGVARKKLYTFLLFCLLGIAFWSLYFLNTSALALFIDRSVNKQILGWTIPTESFASIGAFYMMLLGPFIGPFWLFLRKRFGWDVSLSAKFSGGLIFIGAVYLIIALGIYLNTGEAALSLWWVVVCYLFQSFGELLIGPAGFAMVGTLVPVRMEAVMVGMWELSVGLGGNVTSYLAGLTAVPKATPAASANHLYLQYFAFFGVVTVAIGFLVASIAIWKRCYKYKANHSTFGK